ncbi:MAG: hypothetical protein LBT06_07460 [Hungatella sp.]|nr:hypothetical protein [Hungatella sp.]
MALTNEDLQAIITAMGTLMDEKLQKGLEPIKTEIQDMKQDMQRMEERLNDKIDKVDQKVDELGYRVDELGHRVDELDRKATKTQLLLENEISRKIDIIGEGHDFLKQRLESALQMEKKRESMELQLINLKMEVDKIKEHLNMDIA